MAWGKDSLVSGYLHDPHAHANCPDQKRSKKLNKENTCLHWMCCCLFLDIFWLFVRMEKIPPRRDANIRATALNFFGKMVRIKTGPHSSSHQSVKQITQWCWAWVGIRTVLQQVLLHWSRGSITENCIHLGGTSTIAEVVPVDPGLSRDLNGMNTHYGLALKAWFHNSLDLSLGFRTPNLGQGNLSVKDSNSLMKIIYLA